MTYGIAVFRSRCQAMDCKYKLNGAGIRAELAATPSSLNLGCGVSVRYPLAQAQRAQAIISRAHYSAFYGFMNI